VAGSHAPPAGHVDKPDTVEDQLAWMARAGLKIRIAWWDGGFAVLVGTKPA